MNIYHTKGFINLKKDPFYHIEISKFKLGNLGEKLDETSTDRFLSKDEFESLDMNYLKNHGIPLAPSSINYKNYYDLETILDDSSITLSMEIPRTNVSITNSYKPYNTIFVIYKNLLNDSEEIAFILSDIEYYSGSVYKLNPLPLEKDRNIFKIPKFSYSCTIEFGASNDVKFLEGSGLSEPRSMYEKEIGNYTEVYDPKDKRYVSVVSYDSYLQEIRSQDENDHLDSTFINKFGIKIY